MLNKISFKKFSDWCNDRACDGCWSLNTAKICLNIYDEVKKIPFWKRKKIWKRDYEEFVLNQIVNPINELIKKNKGMFN